MRKPKFPQWWLMLALGSMIIGLVLLAQVGGISADRAGMLLVVYGAALIALWARPIVRALDGRIANLETRIARTARRFY